MLVKLVGTEINKSPFNAKDMPQDDEHFLTLLGRQIEDLQIAHRGKAPAMLDISPERHLAMLGEAGLAVDGK